MPHLPPILIELLNRRRQAQAEEQPEDQDASEDTDGENSPDDIEDHLDSQDPQDGLDPRHPPHRHARPNGPDDDYEEPSEWDVWRHAEDDGQDGKHIASPEDDKQPPPAPDQDAEILPNHGSSFDRPDAVRKSLNERAAWRGEVRDDFAKALLVDRRVDIQPENTRKIAFVLSKGEGRRVNGQPAMEDSSGGGVTHRAGEAGTDRPQAWGNGHHSRHRKPEKKEGPTNTLKELPTLEESEVHGPARTPIRRTASIPQTKVHREGEYTHIKTLPTEVVRRRDGKVQRYHKKVGEETNGEPDSGEEPKTKAKRSKSEETPYRESPAKGTFLPKKKLAENWERPGSTPKDIATD